ncbi:hypothetical protein GWI33_020535 [Rhynchophorus ferrugineus]|uniref:Anaphase-promoting complex subunit 2 n=1 Tax=Rhynchophorus ferrugineus TaxID=354439 RepID=A0A834HW97_RHYFE|nr:hypothetical protein GWI33_020535 [Rhynchophorus ferrugineus]
MEEILFDTKIQWARIKKIFPILDNEISATPFSKNEFEDLCNIVKTNQIEIILQDIIMNKTEKLLRDKIAPEFWSYFKNHSAENKKFDLFFNAVKSVYNNYKELCNIMSRLELLRKEVNIVEVPYNELTVHDSLRLILRATLFSQLHVDYQTLVIEFYELVLRMEDREESNTPCLICEVEPYCNCFHLFEETNRKLGEMSLLEPLVGQALTDLSYHYIYAHIQKNSKDNYESFIVPLEKWLHSVVINWLKKIYSHDSYVPLSEYMEMFEKKLVNYLYNAYTKIRIDQLFNIVIEYPESLPALEDIRICLPRTDLKPMLTKKLQKAMETRLLHPGVSTTDILTAYVATIRSLRVLDPSGLLLETVTQPIHQYLRSREDTVRCVVSSLTEEGPNDLAEELNRGEPVDENAPVDDEDENWETWVPDPVDALPCKQSPKETNPSRRNADIISMLVNIYGSKELFVNEYRTLLADRLLSQYTCDTEKEIRYLELLKLRFGDSHLHFCEVMLKDIADSKRINQRIKEDAEYLESDIPLSTMIVSQQFWPPFKDEKLELHHTVVDQMKQFTARFETLKGSRTLCWKSHLGVVNLDIELNDRTVNLSVSPIQATILLHFQDRNVWELEELSKVILCPATVLRRKIGFWLSHGILVETKPDVFCVQEKVEHKAAPQEDFYVEEFESESAMASAKDQKEEELQNIWSYILGPTTECGQSELKAFLDRKVRERQLIFANGLYKLPK